MATDCVLKIEDRERMNLAGLMLAGILSKNIQTPRGAKRAAQLVGGLGVVAGKMKLTIRFDRGEITIVRGLESKLKSKVKGSLAGLLGVALGASPIRAYWSGAIAFVGNPFFLLRVLPLIRAASIESDQP